MGANGSMVVGSFRNGGGFYWMPTTGVVFVGGKNASSVSRDGKTIVGTAFDQRVSQAAIWLRSAEWKVLGSVVPNAVPCDDLLSSAYDTSADGKVIVGLAWNGCNFARAFRWEESTGMVDLGSTVPGRSSRANGVSGNGRVVVGWQEHATGPRHGSAVGRRPANDLYRRHRIRRRSIRGDDRRVDDRRAGLPWRRPTGSERVGLDAGGRRRLPAVAAHPAAAAVYIGAAYAVSDDGRVIAAHKASASKAKR